MLQVERIFSIISQETGMNTWFFLTREGRKGPFSSKTNAQLALTNYLSNCLLHPDSSRKRTRVISNRFVPEPNS
jgi:hypothetical protein